MMLTSELPAQLRPRIGRYLSPEPELQDPVFALHNAHRGLSTPAYAYALSSPIHYTDPTGRSPAGVLPLVPLAGAAAAWTAIVYCRANPQACIDILRDTPLNPERWPQPLLPPVQSERLPTPSPLPIPGEEGICADYPKDKNDCNKVKAEARERCLAQGLNAHLCRLVADAAFAGCMIARPFQ